MHTGMHTFVGSLIFYLEMWLRQSGYANRRDRAPTILRPNTQELLYRWSLTLRRYDQGRQPLLLIVFLYRSMSSLLRLCELAHTSQEPALADLGNDVNTR